MQDINFECPASQHMSTCSLWDSFQLLCLISCHRCLLWHGCSTHTHLTFRWHAHIQAPHLISLSQKGLLLFLIGCDDAFIFLLCMWVCILKASSAGWPTSRVRFCLCWSVSRNYNVTVFSHEKICVGLQKHTVVWFPSSPYLTGRTNRAVKSWNGSRIGMTSWPQPSVAKQCFMKCINTHLLLVNNLQSL